MQGNMACCLVLLRLLLPRICWTNFYSSWFKAWEAPDFPLLSSYVPPVYGRYFLPVTARGEILPVNVAIYRPYTGGTSLYILIKVYGCKRIVGDWVKTAIMLASSVAPAPVCFLQSEAALNCCSKRLILLWTSLPERSTVMPFAFMLCVISFAIDDFVLPLVLFPPRHVL